ncbi:hypothetical protein ACTXT7_005901 [Hymenolepis weldensis]
MDPDAMKDIFIQKLHEDVQKILATDVDATPIVQLAGYADKILDYEATVADLQQTVIKQTRDTMEVSTIVFQTIQSQINDNFQCIQDIQINKERDSPAGKDLSSIPLSASTTNGRASIPFGVKRKPFECSPEPEIFRIRCLSLVPIKKTISSKAAQQIKLLLESGRKNSRNAQRNIDRIRMNMIVCNNFEGEITQLSEDISMQKINKQK